MPRKARKEIASNFLHIMVQGINREFIFNKDTYVKAYLRIFKKGLSDTNVVVITYCIMNNHAHFLIYAEKIQDVSKLMRHVNTGYAIYYNKYKNRCGYVFRDRYKSEEILSKKHLLSCIYYIHNNPVKAKMCLSQQEYPYSGYQEYNNKGYLINKKKVKKIFHDYGMDIESILNKKSDDEYKFIDDIQPKSKSRTQEVIKNFLKAKGIYSINELKIDKKMLTELITIMHEDYRLTQKEIAEKLGINKVKISRLVGLQNRKK